MKVKDAFAATYKKINERNNYHIIATHTLLSALISLEEHRGYLELKHLFDTTQERRFTRGIYTTFANFLAKRWKLISTTSVAYFSAPKLAFNQLCLTLAEDLARLHPQQYFPKRGRKPANLHPFSFLMPSLRTYNSVTSMDILESDQQIEDNEITSAIENAEQQVMSPALLELASNLEWSDLEEGQGEPEEKWDEVREEWDEIQEIALTELTDNSVAEEKPEPNIRVVPCVYQKRNSSELLTPEQLAEAITTGKANAAKKKIALHHCVLAENETSIISVMACLVDSKFDNILKQTAAVTQVVRKQIRLKKSEIPKVIFHSREAFQLFLAIEEFNQVRNKGLSIGAAINRLIIRLRAAGWRGKRDGNDRLAGRDAAIGIKKFHNFIRLLPLASYEGLMDASSANNQDSLFRTSWFHALGRVYYFPPAEDERIILSLDEEYELNVSMCNADQYPCVELIADNMESILHLNRELYNFFLDAKILAPSVYEALDDLIDINLGDYESVAKTMQQAENTFKEAQEENAFHPLTPADRLVMGADHSILYDKYIKEKEVTTVKVLAKSLANDVTSLQCVMKALHVNLHEVFLTEGLGVIYLKELLKKNILGILTHKSLLTLVGAQFIRSCVQHPSVLRSIIYQCDFNQALDFVRNVIGREHLIKIFDDPTDVEQFKNPMRSTIKALLSVPGNSFQGGVFFQKSPLTPAASSPMSSPALSTLSLTKRY